MRLCACGVPYLPVENVTAACTDSFSRGLFLIVIWRRFVIVGIVPTLMLVAGSLASRPLQKAAPVLIQPAPTMAEKSKSTSQASK